MVSDDPRSAARAIDAVRRGWPIEVAGDDGSLCLLAIETADMGRLSAFAANASADILLSAERAATLNLVNQGPAASGPVRIAAAPWLDLDAAVGLADPALDLARPFKGPFRAVPLEGGRAAIAALDLATMAGLLPAFFVAPVSATAENASTSVAAIEAYRSPSRLTIASRARLPTRFAERCEIVAFRSPDDAAEHIALVVGEPNGTVPLVRVHSECLTGDAFGSLKCDCGPQLDGALERIAASGWGILLYLRQEGRGIGLINKLRAYTLQDQGFDTVDANRRLGFATDVRDFGVAARMLALLEQRRIRLLSNNPEKVEALENAGCEVVERIPHALGANPHNRAYLDTKRDRTGHWL